MIKDVLHLRAPGNWMNDPNGFIYYQGKYHLFYQHFPYAPVWGTMHWGHAVSSDLIHWEHLDIAVFPSKAYDRNGVFSGSAIEKDGKLYLYYSAVRYLDEDAENIHKAPNDRYETSQALMVSEDGFHFDNWEDKRLILPVSRDERIADAVHTRDPKVWKSQGVYNMVLGSTWRNEIGRVLFYQSSDGVNWEYRNQLCSEQFGRILECPDLFRIKDSDVFIGSPMFIGKESVGYENHAICAVVDYDEKDCLLAFPDCSQLVDYGLDLYAPQTNIDAEGRRVMIAWMRMPKMVEEPGRRPWNGMMCQPRVVDVSEGHIYFRVHPNAEHYFSKEAEVSDRLPKLPCRLQTVLADGAVLNIGGYCLRVKEDCVMADRSRVFEGIEGHRLVSSTPKLSGKYELDIFVSHNLIEVFVNGGQYVISNVVYGLGNEIDGYLKKIYVPEE